MKLSEIQRDLRNSDPAVRYHLSRLQEEIIELKRQMKISAELLVKVVDALNNLRIVNLKLNERWENQLRGIDDESLVQSVLPTPEN